MGLIECGRATCDDQGLVEKEGRFTRPRSSRARFFDRPHWPRAWNRLEILENVFQHYFKVVIFWNRCLNNENNTLRSYLNEGFRRLPRSTVKSTSTANSVAVVMTFPHCCHQKMDLRSVFAKFYQQVFKTLRRGLDESLRHFWNCRFKDRFHEENCFFSSMWVDVSVITCSFDRLPTSKIQIHPMHSPLPSEWSWFLLNSLALVFVR